MKENTSSSYLRFLLFAFFLLGALIDLFGQVSSELIFTGKPTKRSYFIFQLTGKISINQNVKEVGFCYAEHHSPTVKNDKIICNQNKESNSISSLIGQNSLKKGKIYFVRAYCVVDGFVKYGNEENFSTEHQQYEIGEKAFGGRIAYVFEPQDKLFVKGEIHGIVVAESDLRESHTWSTTIQSNRNEFIISTTKQLDEGVGNGKTNTRTIASEIRSKIQDLNVNVPIKIVHYSAAEICATLKLNSYNDWVLPSLNEMQIIWFHQTLELNLSSKNVYWTSTSYSPNKAVAFAFKETPLIKEVNQGFKFAIRPVRYF
jgi:hypothetical protein